LSVEHLFYHAQKRAGLPPDQGATFRYILHALREDGQPVEEEWPYAADQPDPASWQPPKEITTVFKRDGHKNGKLFDSIIEVLSNRRPVIVGMMLTRSFRAATPEGLIPTSPLEMADKADRHAVIAVGYGITDAKETAVLIRNSWGEAWGMKGHAWLLKSYLEPLLLKTAILLEEPDVPSS
jgi:hypothetical protein